MPAPRAPGIRQLFPLPYGSLAWYRRDPLGFMTTNARRFGGVFRHDLGPFTFHLITHPDYVRYVLQENSRNYPRSRHYRFTRAVIGRGLVSVEGDEWRQQRRMVQPAFHAPRIARLAPAMTDAAGAMLDRWEVLYAQAGRSFDLAQEMIRLTLVIVGKALLGVEIGGETGAIGRSIAEGLAYLEHRISNFGSAPLFVPTPRNLRFRRARRTLDRVVYDIIARRRASAVQTQDLLSVLLAVRDDETGAAMSDRELHDQVLTFIGAGHETTAVALTWACYLLSRHPGCEHRLRAEVAAVLGGRTPTADDLPRLAFTRAFIEETLRLYPPIYAVVRDVAFDDVIGGYRIPGRSCVVISPYVTHRLPEFWENPGTFDPDRFTPGRAAQRPRFTYFPFLGGPHHCIGAEFAMTEMTLVLATIVQRFRLRLAPGARAEPKPMLSLRPAGGVPMRVVGA